MRGPDDQQLGVFAKVSVAEGISPDRLISKLRVAIGGVRKELHGLPRLRRSTVGCTSVLPERDLRASVLQVAYSVRSQRLLMAWRNYRLLFRWLVGVNVGSPVWDYLTCSFSQGRLFGKEIVQGFCEQPAVLARVHAPHASTLGADMELTGGVCLQMGQCMRLVGENRGKRGDRRENVYLDKRVNTMPPQGESTAFSNDVLAFQYL